MYLDNGISSSHDSLKYIMVILWKHPKVFKMHSLGIKRSWGMPTNVAVYYGLGDKMVANVFLRGLLPPCTQLSAIISMNEKLLGLKQNNL